MAITMQGSGIAGIDTCSATLRLNDDGFYTLMIGATDMGTGCDTILAQMAAEVRTVRSNGSRWTAWTPTISPF